MLLAFALALDTAELSMEHEYEYVVRSLAVPRTVTVGADCVTHQSGMRTVAVWVVWLRIGVARRARRAWRVEGCMLVWWFGMS
jgi:hypothetical protein